MSGVHRVNSMRTGWEALWCRSLQDTGHTGAALSVNKKHTEENTRKQDSHQLHKESHYYPVHTGLVKPVRNRFHSKPVSNRFKHTAFTHSHANQLRLSPTNIHTLYICNYNNCRWSFQYTCCWSSCWSQRKWYLGECCFINI